MMACRFPSEGEIVYVLRDVWLKWYVFGLHLNVPTWALDNIQNMPGLDDNRRFVEVIKWWKSNIRVADQKWSTLANAVKKVGGYRNLEAELRDMDKALHDNLKGRARKRPYPAQSDEQVLQVEGSGSGQETLTPVEEKFLELVEEMQYLPKDTSKKNDTDSDKTVPMIMHCCGCDQPCLIDLFKERCPNITERRVHVMKTNLVQGTTQNAISAMLKVNLDYHIQIAKDIQKLYGRFITDTNRSFKRRVPIQELTLFLSKSFLSMQLKKDELKKAIFMEDVFHLIPDEWYNYKVIEDMINYFGDDMDKHRLEKYKDCTKEYSRKLLNGVMYLTVGGGRKPKEGELVIVKVIHEKQTLYGPDMLPCWVYLENTLQNSI